VAEGVERHGGWNNMGLYRTMVSYPAARAGSNERRLTVPIVAGTYVGTIGRS
jgi:hypothetical protein